MKQMLTKLVMLILLIGCTKSNDSQDTSKPIPVRWVYLQSYNADGTESTRSTQKYVRDVNPYETIELTFGIDEVEEENTIYVFYSDDGKNFTRGPSVAVSRDKKFYTVTL